MDQAGKQETIVDCGVSVGKQQLLEDSRRRSDVWMARAVRDGIDLQMARALLVASIDQALDSQLRRGVGLSRDEAIDLACDIWCRGVFREPDAPPPPGPDDPGGVRSP